MIDVIDVYVLGIVRQETFHIRYVLTGHSR